MNSKSRNSVKLLCVTAMFMAMNIALSSFGVPVPGGHLYLNDIVICTAAILLPPFEAFAVGGIGAFIGDMIFYPTPMFVSLVTHGLQAVVISLCASRLFGKKRPEAAAWVGVGIGAVIMVVGYTIGRAFIYGTPVDAVVKLPFQIAQAALGAVVSVLLCFKMGLKRLYDKLGK